MIELITILSYVALALLLVAACIGLIIVCVVLWRQLEGFF